MLKYKIPQIVTLILFDVLGLALAEYKKVHNSFKLWTLSLSDSQLSLSLSGAYGTRTRDPMRDRHVF